MEWLINTFNEYFIEITNGGMLILLGFKAFIADSLTNKRMVSNFGSILANTSKVDTEVRKIIEREIGKMLKGEELIFEKFKDVTSAFDMLNETITHLQSENTAVVNLLVQTLSYLNVPVDQKEKTFTALKSIATVNETVMQSLEASIQGDKARKTVAKKKENDILADVERM